MDERGSARDVFPRMINARLAGYGAMDTSASMVRIALLSLTDVVLEGRK